MASREGIVPCFSFCSLKEHSDLGFGQSAVGCMSQTFLHLQDHLTVIVSQCDMLEDIFPARTDVMERINVIRNAAHRIENAIEGQSWPASEMLVEDRRDQCAEWSGRER